MIVGTAGHIDHGKSTLIKALTGSDPDRLKEEKVRGITIDLGFGHLTIDEYVLGIVDVPGHERLVHNMLAGAGGVDIALMVVAADEGVKPQTLEHMEILDLLGIKAAMGVITKIDLVGEDERAVTRLELEELFQQTAMAGAPIVEVSAETGEGLHKLKDMLLRVCGEIEKEQEPRPFRMPLDRVFTIQGFGTVVTGTPLAGSIAVGDGVSGVLSGETFRIRNIEVHGEKKESAGSGERVAVNLTAKKSEIMRGDVLAPPGIFRPTTCVDATMRTIRLPGKRKLRQKKVRVYAGTAHSLALVVPLEENALVPGEEGFVQIRLREPLAVVRGDRFVLRSEDDGQTIGGGTIIDAFASRHGPRRGETAKILRRISINEPAQLLEHILDNSPGGLTIDDLVRRLNMSRESLQTLFTHLKQKNILMVTAEDQKLITRSRVEKDMKRIRDVLSQFHTEHPMRPLMPVSEMRREWNSAERPVFQTALKELSSMGAVLIEADGVRLQDHSARFEGDLEKTREKILDSYMNAELATPSRSDLIQELKDSGYSKPKEVVDSLLEMGYLVPLTHDLLIHSAVLEKAKKALIDELNTQDGITVSRARSILGTTRKYTVPLLELLDRQGFTVRRGDARVLSSNIDITTAGEES